MKKISFLIVFLISGITAFCQQDKMFTQYMNYPASINPAYAGSREVLQILSLGRKQWVGFKGAPESVVISANTPLNANGLNLGVNVELDKIGLTKSNDVSIDIAYRLNLSDKLKLAFGLKGGFSNFNTNFSNYSSTTNYDELLASNLKGSFLGNMGFGLYLNSDKFFVGISIPRMLDYKISQGDVESSSVKKNKRHYYLMAGYLHEISPVVKFKPTVLLKAVGGSRLSYDISAMFIFNNTIWVGTSFRNEDSMAAILQYNISNQLKIGYSYDIPLGDFSQHTQGSHEISISYDFDFQDIKIKSPRYF